MYFQCECLHCKSDRYFLYLQVILLPLTHTRTQSDDADNADRMYDLIGVVVHCGR